MRRKVLLCGTHPKQFNGYSKVMYELSRELCKYEDIDLHIFGFQNFYSDEDHTKERILPDKVTIYDPFLAEEKGSKGFGEKLIKDYVIELSPDIVIIYNDVIVVSGLMKQLLTIEERKFKIVPYIDLVYQNEKKLYLDYIHKSCDSIISFTDYWKSELQKHGFSKRIHVLNHAFNDQNFFPIPQAVARKYFDLGPDEFIILNLNRNQPRKRWDICIQAYIKFISVHKGEKVKLLVMTNVQGSWDLIELLKFEGAKYDMDISDLKNYFTFIQNPQKISDAEINVMYNAADIGWNTCDGEGFGLCNFEQAGVGKPQVVPNIGGFKDFFTSVNSQLVEPVLGIYGDTSKDACGGFQELCSIDAHVEALERYYSSRELITQHGKQARHDIRKYTWPDQARILRDVILEETADLFPDKASSRTLLQSINEILEDRGEGDSGLDDEDLDDVANVNIDNLIAAKLKLKEGRSIKKTDDEKLEEMSPNDLIQMQQKIQNILNMKNMSQMS